MFDANAHVDMIPGDPAASNPYRLAGTKSVDGA